MRTLATVIAVVVLVIAISISRDIAGISRDVAQSRCIGHAWLDMSNGC